MRTLALIPARAGSKGLPGKNTRPFRGIPLILRAAEIGLDSCNACLVSTDDPKAAALAKAYGCRVVNRPPELARDDTPMLPVIQHVLENMRELPEVVVLLQPTAPLRRRIHVIRALADLETSGADSVVSVTPIPAHMGPDYALTVTEGRTLQRVTGTIVDTIPKRRQNTEPAYYLDGTVYAIRRQTIEAGRLFGAHCRPLIIPASESATIDTEDDWLLAEAKNG